MEAQPWAYRVKLCPPWRPKERPPPVSRATRRRNRRILSYIFGLLPVHAVRRIFWECTLADINMWMDFVPYAERFITSIREYEVFREAAGETLEAIKNTGVAKDFKFADFYKLLLHPFCYFCRINFAPFLFLPLQQRCCYHCNFMHSMTRVAPLDEAAANYRMDPDIIATKVAVVETLPGFYGNDDHKMYWGEREKVVSLHAVESLVEDMALTLVNRTKDKFDALRNSRRLGLVSAWNLVSGGGLIHCEQRSTLAFLPPFQSALYPALYAFRATLDLPYIDLPSGRIEDGFYCACCTNVYVTAKRSGKVKGAYLEVLKVYYYRVYLSYELRDHFRVCPARRFLGTIGFNRDLIDFKQDLEPNGHAVLVRLTDHAPINGTQN